MNNKKLAFFLIFIMIVTLMGTSGCGAAKISDEKSPCLENVFLKTYNNGSESSQFVEVTLRFDREIAAGKKILSNMKVTISGTRMTDITASKTDDDTITLEIPVAAVTKGLLSIAEEKEGKGYSGITESTGRYYAKTFSVDAVIPSGVTLEDTQETNGNGFVKNVKGIWNIRCITWVKLLENGETVPGEPCAQLDELDGAIAVHGHDFLTSDTTMIAGAIVESLNDHYGSAYVFHQDGTRIYGSKLDESDGTKLDLQIYTYTDFK